MPFHEKSARLEKASSSRPKKSLGTTGGSAIASIAGLQQGLGNRGMHRWIAQMKRDPSMPVQRAASPEEEELQMKRDPSRAIQRESEGPELEEEELQMKRDSSKAIQRKSNGIPEPVLQKMEASFGASFEGVNIHVGGEASEVGALAYTQGSDIHFAPGQYRPDTKSGQELLGHELAHVVQQREGRVQPTAEVAGVPLNDEKSLEAEADRLGAKAAAGR
ncbi:DUF4157 domain-containing protein [Paenibacillus sp.]|uniref:eCIS core domain-containing protein n=1 Tax=Paenibacillus sp. TaxID=58172 RepID=UPI0028111A44|nr:DUF4157 domain-containing protein [Paenibacillus sp.]